MMLLWNLSPTVQSLPVRGNPSSPSWITMAAAERGKNVLQRNRSAFETRISLVLALASQAASLSQRVLGNLVEETTKYAFPRRFEARTLEEALMLVPDLETVRYRVLKQTDQYEVREVEPYYIAETTMPGKTGFDFNGASKGFNVLAEYLFGKNTTNEQMEMTTPVITRKVQSNGEKMDMTTPVITKQPYYVAETTMPGKTGFDFNGASKGFNVLAEYLFGKNTTNEQMEMTTPVITRKVQSNGEKMDMTTPVITKQSGDNWTMSFVMPSKYGAKLPLPKDPSVRIKQVPQKIVAVTAFSGFVTDENVKQRELKLRNALRGDSQFQVKQNAFVEVSQFNPPFTLPFTRRNEIALEVEQKAE